MDNPDLVLARLVVEQHGMTIRSQALDEGLTARQYRTRRESWLLVPMHRGIARHAAVPLTWKGRLAAAVLAGGDGAVASHRSAARLHGLAHVPRWRPEVTSPATDLPRADGVHFHRTNLLDPVDVTVVDGIPCTTIARTLLDLGAVLPAEIVAEVVADAIIRNLVTADEAPPPCGRACAAGSRTSDWRASSSDDCSTSFRRTTLSCSSTS